MRRHVAREECDTTDEVCSLFNEVFQELRSLALALSEVVTKLEKAKPAVQGKKKGGES